jgi:hypothetical protein
MFGHRGAIIRELFLQKSIRPARLAKYCVAFIKITDKTHFMSNNFFPPKNRAVYEIMWKNMVQPDRPQMTI